MKVLFIIDRLGAGGKERQLVELLKGLIWLHRISCQLIVLSSEIHYSELRSLDIKIYLIKRKRKMDYSALKKIFTISKSFKPDLIHSWESIASLYVLPASKFFHIKLINSVIRNAPSKINRFSQTWIRTRFLLRFSDLILANSKAGLVSYKIPKDKSYCIHNGFDFSRIDHLMEKSKIRMQFKIFAPKVVGMVGKFTDKKDYKTFILAASRILERRDDINFLMIGDGKYLDLCKHLAQNKNILFLGNQKNIESIINVFDIGVLATFTEGISNSIMEYMALGKPVIATDGGGTKELMADGETGLLVKESDVSQLVDCLELLLENNDLAKKMGRRGKERLRKNFDLERMTLQMVNLYEKCLV